LFEFIVLGRFFADYFWEYKEIGVSHFILVFIFSLLRALKYNQNGLEVRRVDAHVALFFIAIVFAFINSINADSLLEFLKFTTYLIFFYIGRLFPLGLLNFRIIGVASFVLLICFFVMSIFGYGYLYWGNVLTFSGGYYFKTDLAIASIIFLAFVIAFFENRYINLLAFGLTGYLVFISNARIALPLVIIIPIFSYYAKRGDFGDFNIQNLLKIIGVLASGMMIFLLIDFGGMGMLGFDFSDPFSSANTQGRSLIWSAIIDFYSSVSILAKLFGSGFDADITATIIFSEVINLEGARAHNSYLYLLVSIGIFGSLIFYSLLYEIFRVIPFLIRSGKRSGVRIISALSCSFLILFFWLSLTTDIVIRPQLMILLFFFSGLHFQAYVDMKPIGRK